MSEPIELGEIVRCIDSSAKPEWAEWYQDADYAGDMLINGGLYRVRAVATRDGQTGYDVGIPTPWGDPFWNADRFERAMMRLADNAGALAHAL